MENLAAVSDATDVATKAYADSVGGGVSSWKQAVRAASTATVTLASGVENGDTLDGVTLVTGDRILLKNQSSGAENGIYVVAASGAPTRATDADSASDLRGTIVFVEEGTVNADSIWRLTTNATITVDTTALVFAGDKYTATLGNNSSTSFTITHNLGTKNVHVSVWEEASTYEEVMPTVRHTSTTEVTLVFSVAPTTDQYRVLVSRP